MPGLLHTDTFAHQHSPSTMKSAIVLAVLSVVGLAAATTFPDRARLIWKAPPAFPATRRDCAFLPQRPLMAPPHPAWIDDVCARTSCPSAPGQCWEDSTCSSYSGEAVCEPFRPKAFGVPCNDGDKSTHNDVCGGDGKCHGVGESSFLLAAARLLAASLFAPLAPSRPHLLEPRPPFRPLATTLALLLALLTRCCCLPPPLLSLSPFSPGVPCRSRCQAGACSSPR